ncbi:MAG: type IV pili methyl-accepting chemotaxis transducer N-terminal domain-containing protein [Chromatiaceae bacterium]
MIQRLTTKPILLRIGVLLSLIVMLAAVSMLSSVFIARTTEGLAAAVNQSGSLRMQSYRISTALADQSVPAPERAERVARLAGEFESRLASPRLADAIPAETGDEVGAAYRRIRDAWADRMRPPLADHLQQLREPRSTPEPGSPLAAIHYLRDVDGFVAEVDDLVGRLERVAEGRIARLQRIQAVVLLLTVLVVAVTLVLVLRRVITPLGELLTCADRARRWDFTGRTRFTGEDELGRLGSAMNRMAEDLSRLHADLEQRVAEKTRDLERTNHSLELLYRIGSRLNDSSISEPLLKRVLKDIQDGLGVGPVTLCLQEDPDQERGRRTLTTRSRREQLGACSRAGCLACRDGPTASAFGLPIGDGTRRRVASFPVGERDERSGVLIVDLAAEGDERSQLAPWQARLLGTLAGHLGTALKLERRLREGRRLALYEERGILARELHDSLAQSLSYLKIQAARLTGALDTGDGVQARAVLGELRDGISSAYRQLRELLTTFRLKMDDRGLNAALESTVQEFRQRSTADIVLDNRLPATLLTANEEIHVLQIVREALSNVVRHASARHASVRLELTSDAVEVVVSDDGHGFEGDGDRARHYGLAIMRERALSLDGNLSVESVLSGGTSVRLLFRHRASLEAEPVSLGAAGIA